MNCREFTEIASAWLDGEIADARRNAAAEHLAGCEHCARLVEDLTAVDGALKSEPAVERSEAEWESFNRRLMVHIAMDGRERLERRSGRAGRMLKLTMKFAAAAAALLLAAWAGHALRGGGDGGGNGAGDPTHDPLAVEFVPEFGGGALPVVMGDLNGSSLSEEQRAELARLLAAAERVFMRLKNADPSDAEELAAIRSAVIDSGLSQRLTEVRHAADAADPAMEAARPVEMLLLRVSNGAPTETSEFNDIRNAVLDNSLIERTRSLREKM